MSTPPAAVAAIVNGRAVPVARVTERAMATAPPPATASWAGRERAVRQHRRWTAQVIVAEEVVSQECRRLGLDTDDNAPAYDEDWYADVGGITAAVLHSCAAARALVSHLASTQNVTEAETYDYYRRNPDRFLTAEALRGGVDPFALARPDGVAVRHLYPYPEMRAGIEDYLRQTKARRAFVCWLDEQRRSVVLMPGYEHPGDPAQPDAEHRH